VLKRAGRTRWPPVLALAAIRNCSKHYNLLGPKRPSVPSVVLWNGPSSTLGHPRELRAAGKAGASPLATGDLLVAKLGTRGPRSGRL